MKYPFSRLCVEYGVYPLKRGGYTYSNMPYSIQHRYSNIHQYTSIFDAMNNVPPVPLSGTDGLEVVGRPVTRRMLKNSGANMRAIGKAKRISEGRMVAISNAVNVNYHNSTAELWQIHRVLK